MILLISALFFMQCSKSGTPSNAQEPSTEASTIVRLVNQYRSKVCDCGATPFKAVPQVKWSKRISEVAQAHSEDMARRGKLDHYSANGDGPGARLRKAGYRWSFYTENVAQGNLTPQQVMELWMKSPAHCANIMNDRVNEVGIGHSGTYWTLLFGSEKRKTKSE